MSLGGPPEGVSRKFNALPGQARAADRRVDRATGARRNVGRRPYSPRMRSAEPLEAITPMHPFEALAEPARRRIIDVLASGEHTAGELAAVVGEEFRISRTAVSKHLRILRDAGSSTSAVTSSGAGIGSPPTVSITSRLSWRTSAESGPFESDGTTSSAPSRTRSPASPALCPGRARADPRAEVDGGSRPHRRSRASPTRAGREAPRLEP